MPALNEARATRDWPRWLRRSPDSVMVAEHEAEALEDAERQKIPHSNPTLAGFPPLPPGEKD